MSPDGKIENLEELIEEGWSVSFNWVGKRIDGYNRARLIWKADKHDHKNLECKWEGFENTLDAVEDLLRVVNSLKIVKKYNL